MVLSGPQVPAALFKCAPTVRSKAHTCSATQSGLQAYAIDQFFSFNKEAPMASIVHILPV
jgi:hypothetical protein